MELDPVLVALFVDQFEGVGAVAVHVAIAVRDSAVREEEGDLVHRLPSQRDEVPEHVRVLGMQRDAVVKALNLLDIWRVRTRVDWFTQQRAFLHFWRT